MEIPGTEFMGIIVERLGQKIVVTCIKSKSKLLWLECVKQTGTCKQVRSQLALILWVIFKSELSGNFCHWASLELVSTPSTHGQKDTPLHLPFRSKN